MNRTLRSLGAALGLSVLAVFASAAVEGVVESPKPNGIYTDVMFLRGWVADNASPFRQLEVRVYEGASLRATFPADKYHPGAAQRFGEGNAMHGFHFKMTGVPPGSRAYTFKVFDPARRVESPWVGPIPVQVTSLAGRFLSPPYGVPASTRFELKGVLLDKANLGATVSGYVVYRSNLQTTDVVVPVTANLPTPDLGNHGFSLWLDLPSQQHWYITLVIPWQNQPLFGDFLNVDTYCLPAQAGADATVCPMRCVRIGTQPPQLFGAASTFRWSPAAGLSDPNIATPMACPLETTTYTLTVTDPLGGCAFTDQVTVVVTPARIAASAALSACAPDNGTVAVSLSGQVLEGNASGVRWNWDLNNDGVWDLVDLASPAVTVNQPAGTYTAKLHAAFANGCCTMADVTYTVAPCFSGETCAPRTVGYWSQQFDGLPAQKENACLLLDGLEAQSLVYFEALDANEDRCAQVREILETWGGDTMWKKAARQLVALWFNLLSGKIEAGQGIDLTYSASATVGDGIREIEAALTNPASSESELERVKDIADALNNSCGYAPGCVEACGLELSVAKNPDGTVKLQWSRGEGPTYLLRRDADGVVTTSAVPEPSSTDAPSGNLIFYNVDGP